MQNVERRYLAENQDDACGRGKGDMDTTPITFAALSGLWIIMAGSIAAAVLYSLVWAWCCLPRGKAPATVDARTSAQKSTQSSASTALQVRQRSHSGN